MKDSTKYNNKSIGSYSLIQEIGGFIYLAGIAAREKDKRVGGVDVLEDNVTRVPNIQKQTRLVIETLKERLKTVDATLENVVDVNVFLVNMKDLKVFNETYAEYFYGDSAPTRTTVAVHQLPDPEMLIEIKVVAHRDK